MVRAQAQAIKVFFSYARKDEPLLKELEKHLSSLRRQGLITNWHKGLVDGGGDRAQAINDHLNTSSIILLLISPDFMNSDSIYSNEIPRAMELHKAGRTQVIPILLRPIDWSGAPFAKLQPLPTNRRPITTWNKRDQAFLAVAQGIREAVEHIHASLDNDGFVLLSSSASAQTPTTKLDILKKGISEKNPFEEQKTSSPVTSPSFESRNDPSIRALHFPKLSTPLPKHRYGRTHLKSRATVAVMLSFLLCISVVISVLARPRVCLQINCLFTFATSSTNLSQSNEATLAVSFVRFQSTSILLPGGPGKYTLDNLPQDDSPSSIGAVLTNGKVKSPPYDLELELHNPQKGPFQLLIDNIELVVNHISPLQRPVSVWMDASGTDLPMNPQEAAYKAVYSGQQAGVLNTDLPHDYYYLKPGEYDRINVLLHSQVEVDLRFQVQFTYHFANEARNYTMTFPQIFEVIFSNPSDWQPYHLLPNGHLITVQ